MIDYAIAVLLGCLIGVAVAVLSWNSVLRDVAADFRKRL